MAATSVWPEHVVGLAEAIIQDPDDALADMMADALEELGLPRLSGHFRLVGGEHKPRPKRTGDLWRGSCCCPLCASFPRSRHCDVSAKIILGGIMGIPSYPPEQEDPEWFAMDREFNAFVTRKTTDEHLL